MPFSAGAQLGPYQIVSALGAGGMGEVYRARDTRLGRDVAIKRHLKTLADLWTLSTSGTPPATPYTQFPLNEDLAVFSPDGRWVAYASDEGTPAPESGRREVWVTSYPSPVTRYQVSTQGGSQPRWRGDGKELFFIERTNPASRLVSVTVDVSGKGLVFGIPQLLFESYAVATGAPLVQHAPFRSYAVTNDQRPGPMTNDQRPTTKAAGVFLVAAFLAAGCQREPRDPADLVLLNGKIVTVNASDDLAEAVAVTGGRIVAVGSTEEMRARVGAATRVIDLNGRTATPGLIDAHTHFSAAGELYNIDLSGLEIKKMSDVVERVAAKVKSLKPGEWAQGSGWDEGKLAERRYITAADLDAVAPDNPVWLMHTTGHYGVGNSAALEAAGITRLSKDPPAGTIDRDARGNPTGVLKESAMGLVTSKVPPLTREQQKNGIIKIVQEFNKEGMTGVKDPGIGQAKWELYEELLKEGKLTVRVFALWRESSVESIKRAIARLEKLPRPPASLGDGRLLSGGVKLAIDGSGGARTAWMYEDWNRNFNEKDAGNKGYPTFPPDEYREGVALLHDAGIHVSTHAIGDRAIDWVVDSYDKALAGKPTRGLRHGIIHANVPTDHANEVMARLQREFDAGYPEAQGTFLWWLGDNYAGNLGPERALRLKPFKTWQDKGIKWAGGSDYFVTPFAARYSMWASVTRKTLHGTYGSQPFGTKEAIDIKTALRAQTIWAAHQMFLEDRIGSIEVGKDADIAVWDRDLLTIPADDLKNLKAELTLMRGEVVFQDPSGSVTLR